MTATRPNYQNEQGTWQEKTRSKSFLYRQRVRPGLSDLERISDTLARVGSYIHGGFFQKKGEPAAAPYQRQSKGRVHRRGLGEKKILREIAASRPDKNILVCKWAIGDRGSVNRGQRGNPATPANGKSCFLQDTHRDGAAVETGNLPVWQP